MEPFSAAILGGASLISGLIGGNQAARAQRQAAAAQREANQVAREQLALQRQAYEDVRPFMQAGLRSGLDTTDRVTDIYDDLAALAGTELLGYAREARTLEDQLRDYLFGRNKTNDRLALENRDYGRTRQRTIDLEAAERAARFRDATEGDRRRLITRSANLDEELTRTAQGFGDAPELRRFSEEDVQRETDVRYQSARSAAERAAAVAASANEAALISSGIDASTSGTERRAALAARIAPLFEEAFARSRDGALAFVRGQQEREATGFTAEMQRRSAILNEIINRALAPANIEMRLPTFQAQPAAIGPTIPTDSGINTAAITNMPGSDFGRALSLYLDGTARAAGGLQTAAGAYFTGPRGSFVEVNPQGAVALADSARRGLDSAHAQLTQANTALGTSFSNTLTRLAPVIDRLPTQIGNWWNSMQPQSGPLDGIS